MSDAPTPQAASAETNTFAASESRKEKEASAQHQRRGEGSLLTKDVEDAFERVGLRYGHIADGIHRAAQLADNTGSAEEADHDAENGGERAVPGGGRGAEDRGGDGGSGCACDIAGLRDDFIPRGIGTVNQTGDRGDDDEQRRDGEKSVEGESGAEARGVMAAPARGARDEESGEIPDAGRAYAK